MSQENKLFEGKRYLITGGTGFIGKRFVERLKATKATCEVVTRQQLASQDNIHYIQCDLNDMEQLENLFLKQTEKYDAIVYMAANIPQVGMKKENYLDAKCSTLDPIVNFCQVAMPHCHKFIYISSIDVIGVPENEDYTEEEVARPATPYALAKYCGEFYVEKIAQVNNVPLTSLRFSQVYGPNEPLVRVIPILINAVKEGKPFNKFTTGDEKRRFLYVEDAVTSIVRALESEATGIFNIAGKSIDTINDLLNIVGDIQGKAVDINIVAESVAGNNVPNIDKAEKVLNYIPEYTLEQGIHCILGGMKNE